MSTARAKPHILIVSERWCDGIPEHGESNSMHSFWGPLEACGAASYELFHFDEYYHRHGSRGDAALLSRCMSVRPDLIFLIWLPLPAHHLNPSLDTLLALRAELDIPIISWWGDTHSAHIMAIAEIVAPYVDLTLLGDSLRREDANYLALPHPKDPRIFFDPGKARDIDASFVGSVQRAERQATLEMLGACGIEVFQTGGQRESKLPIQEYADYLQRSKIAINFNSYDPGGNIINGRIFEATLCGALLLEPVWSGAERWLRRGEEFVTYENDADLAEKIRYYLAHPEERQKIADRGREAAAARYSGGTFWRTVLDRAASSRPLQMEAALLAASRRAAAAGRQAQALTLTLRALKHDPNSFRALAQLRDLQRDEDLGTAREIAQRCVELRPDCENLARLADILIRQGRPEEAAQIVDRALALDRGTVLVESSVELATLLMELGRHLESSEILTNALIADPQRRILYIRLAEVLLRAGRQDDAQNIVQRALTSWGNHPDIHSALADLHAKLGDTQRAAYHRWLSRRPDERTAESVVQESWLLELCGESAAAGALVERYAAYNRSAELQRRLAELRASADVPLANGAGLSC